jgi:ABC-2 type transport system ATP-binding protein
VAIIAGGEIVAQGAPGDLRGRAGEASTITFGLPSGAAAKLPPLVAAAIDGEPSNGSVRLRSEAPVELLSELTRWALDGGVELTELEVRRPSLEDTYLELMGDGE